MQLIHEKPHGFSVLTGEDVLYYVNLALGGDGGILAAAHIDTEKYVDIFKLMQSNNHVDALKTWKLIESIIPLLFIEPNPAPLKYLLAKKGLISSSELRLPLTEISEGLKEKLDRFI